MTIGTGVVLFVIGAILAFALNIDVGWADLTMIGYILMACGLLVVIIGIVLSFRKRHTVVTRREGIDRRTGQRYDSTDRGDRL